MLLGRVLLLVSFITVGAWAQAPNFYRDQMEPVLKRTCLPCHNAQVKQGGFDLSTREALLRGSEHGKVVVPGNPNESQLYKLVAHVSEPAMPFKSKKLPDDVVAKFSEWIKQGVPYGEGAADPDAPNLT